MNKAILIGRLTDYPELKETSNNYKYCNFTLAVDRNFKNANGERDTDFINVVAWNKTAEFIAKYFEKGSKLGVVGRIQTRSWEDIKGIRKYRTEVVVEEAHFIESKANADANRERSNQESAAEDMLPFDL